MNEAPPKCVCGNAGHPLLDNYCNWCYREIVVYSLSEAQYHATRAYSEALDKAYEVECQMGLRVRATDDRSPETRGTGGAGRRASGRTASHTPSLDDVE